MDPTVVGEASTLGLAALVTASIQVLKLAKVLQGDKAILLAAFGLAVALKFLFLAADPSVVFTRPVLAAGAIEALQVGISSSGLYEWVVKPVAKRIKDSQAPDPSIDPPLPPPHGAGS